jgi:hypothetical protein
LITTEHPRGDFLSDHVSRSSIAPRTCALFVIRSAHYSCSPTDATLLSDGQPIPEDYPRSQDLRALVEGSEPKPVTARWFDKKHEVLGLLDPAESGVFGIHGVQTWCALEIQDLPAE